ncbi:MAG: DMT family transporter [Actinomycetia bacterium]|nr:DMT family transporter [Actinomycetes bacterium]
MSRTLRANLLLLVTAAIWGSAFVAQRLGAEETGPASFNAVRNLLGSLALLPVVIGFDRVGTVSQEQRRTLWRQAWKPGMLAGSVLTGGTMLQQAGLEYTTAGNASFITGLYLVLIPLAALVLLRVRTSGWTWVAVVLALAGLYLLSIREGLHINTGDLLVLVCSFFWTAHILVIDRIGSRVDSVRLCVVQFATCSAISALLALVLETHPFTGLVGAAIPLAYTAFLSTGVGFTLQAVAQRDAKAAHAAIIMSLETVFGAVAGALWLAERMDLRGVTGCALMLAAVIVAQLGNLPKPQPGEQSDQG